MCTTISKNANGLIFGRNMDIECSFGEKFVFTPRNYPLNYKCLATNESHYAMYGTAAVIDNCPLYAEGANEKGLCIAALNFVGNAHYRDYADGRINVAPYELIPVILSSCCSVEEARHLLSDINIVAIPFKEGIPLPSLHYHIADEKESIVFEATENGNKIYSNPVGVLANNPQFNIQLSNLSAYNHLKNQTREPTFYGIEPYSYGICATGLPGDYSSFSRFVKASYISHFSSWEDKIPQMLHLLSAVSVPKGAVVNNGKEHYTLYKCCIDAKEHIYYYRPYSSLETVVINTAKLPIDAARLEIFDFMC